MSSPGYVVSPSFTESILAAGGEHFPSFPVWNSWESRPTGSRNLPSVLPDSSSGSGRKCQMSLRPPQGKEGPGIYRENLLGSPARTSYSIPLVFQLYQWATNQKTVKTGLTKETQEQMQQQWLWKCILETQRHLRSRNRRSKVSSTHAAFLVCFEMVSQRAPRQILNSAIFLR